MSKKGIMVCGHGSRDKDAEREFGLVAAGLKKRFPDIPVEYGFLEFSAPNIHMGLNSLLEQALNRSMPFRACCLRRPMPRMIFRLC